MWGQLAARRERVCGDNLLRTGRGGVGTICCAPGGGVWGQLVIDVVVVVCFFSIKI